MSHVTLGVICGACFGLFAALTMLPISFPDKRAAITAAVIDRFAIGLVLGVVVVPWPWWATGVCFGILLSAPSAIITRAYKPILGLGALGGVVISYIVAHFGGVASAL